ncbi:MAG: SPOR domain-containing protein [Deltaproteobacteria bacterium]|nr:SPOR domain-containing protein [Deltaproteobacteria bacterium]
MRTGKFLSKINIIILFMLSFWATAPAGHCQAGQQSFTVQVMSGSDKEAASRFVEELIQKGFDAFIAEVPGKEKTLYKVHVGNCTHRKDAAQLYEALRMKGIAGWITQGLEPPAQEHAEEKPEQVQPQPHETAAEKKAAVKDEPEARAELQPEPAPAAEEKPFVLIIHPVPTFADEETPAKASIEKAVQPVSQPAKTYKYFNPVDKTIHITTGIEAVPVSCRRLIGEIAIYPVYFKSINLRDMSMKLDIEGANQEVLLEGITQPVREPPVQTIGNFEAALRAAPLRIKYYPQRTDPDGTLHGSIFFKDGVSVERDMVRRGLAACADDSLPWLLHKACSDTAGQASEQPGPSTKTQH